MFRPVFGVHKPPYRKPILQQPSNNYSSILRWKICTNYLSKLSGDSNFRNIFRKAQKPRFTNKSLTREEIFSQETESLKEQDFLISCQSLRAQFLNACCLMLASIKNPSICFVSTFDQTDLDNFPARVFFKFWDFLVFRFGGLQIWKCWGRFGMINPAQNRF